MLDVRSREPKERVVRMLFGSLDQRLKKDGAIRSGIATCVIAHEKRVSLSTRRVFPPDTGRVLEFLITRIIYRPVKSPIVLQLANFGVGAMTSRTKSDEIV
jgi:hypothetical protein